MRLWSIHPKYLDRQGLVALWREGLLAQAVLLGRTKGYKNHPQLDRFKSHPTPLEAIGSYLQVVFQEAQNRGYKFNQTKIKTLGNPEPINLNSGQIEFETSHLLAKLKVRDPEKFRLLNKTSVLDPHPSFRIISGGIEKWERVN